MSEKTQKYADILKPVWSHLIVAGITSILSFVFITGTYKTKIDSLIVQTQENQVAIQRLTDIVNAQTVQIAQLTTELRVYQRENGQRNR